MSRLGLRCRQFRLGVERLLGEALGLAHRQPAGGDQVGEADLGGAVEGSRAGRGPCRCRRPSAAPAPAGQLEQAQQVGGGRAGAPDGFGGLLVGHAELVDEALDAGGLLEGLRSSRWMFSMSDIASAASSGMSRTRQGTSASRRSGRHASGVRRR